MNDMVNTLGTETGWMLDVREIRRLGRDTGGRHCKCCDLDDEQLHDLNMQIMKRVPYRTVAQQADMHHVSVLRHATRHLFPEVLRLLNEADEILDTNLMDPRRVIHDLGRSRQIALGIAGDDGAEKRDQLGALKVNHSISRTALELSGNLKGSQTNVSVAIDNGAMSGQIQPVLDAVFDVLEAAGQFDLIQAISDRLAGTAALDITPILEVEAMEAEALPAAE